MGNFKCCPNLKENSKKYQFCALLISINVCSFEIWCSLLYVRLTSKEAGLALRILINNALIHVA
jgi:hypothetical protein